MLVGERIKARQMLKKRSWQGDTNADRYCCKHINQAVKEGFVTQRGYIKLAFPTKVNFVSSHEFTRFGWNVLFRMSRVPCAFHVESGCLVVAFFPMEGEVDLCRERP